MHLRLHKSILGAIVASVPLEQPPLTRNKNSKSYKSEQFTYFWQKGKPESKDCNYACHRMHGFCRRPVSGLTKTGLVLMYKLCFPTNLDDFDFPFFKIAASGKTQEWILSIRWVSFRLGKLFNGPYKHLCIYFDLVCTE